MDSSSSTAPLKIVAVFAGLAEIAGVTVLPLLSENLQEIFIWYVMIFPVALLVFFFLTWNFNTKVLYPPDAYKNEKHFLNMLGIDILSDELEKQTNNFEEVFAQFEKLKLEMLESKSVPSGIHQTQPKDESEDTSTTKSITNDEKTNNPSIEELSSKMFVTLENSKRALDTKRIVRSSLHNRNPYALRALHSLGEGKCDLCGRMLLYSSDGKSSLEAHHIKPLSEGGEDNLENMILLCPTCHSKFDCGNIDSITLNMLKEQAKMRKYYHFAG